MYDFSFHDVCYLHGKNFGKCLNAHIHTRLHVRNYIWIDYRQWLWVSWSPILYIIFHPNSVFDSSILYTIKGKPSLNCDFYESVVVPITVLIFVLLSLCVNQWFTYLSTLPRGRMPFRLPPLLLISTTNLRDPERIYTCIDTKLLKIKHLISQ